MHSTDESLSNQDKKKWKQKNKFTDASTFDNGVFDSLQQIISSIDITDEGASNDFQSIIEFFQKGFASQATQAWSYYAQVNNHHMFTDTSIKLTRTLKILNFDPSLHEYGSTLIGDILSKYAKVLYRGLNNLRPSITNPIIRLMKEIVSFHQGQHVDDFLSFFDLSLSSLPKILTPSKAELADVELAQNNSHFSMRFNFIKFWLALIENATPLLRKDILVENHKIMSTWVKHMNKVDTTELMEQTITVFMEKILQEKSFKKITKCKILNELVVSKIHGFYYSSSKNLVKQVDNFFQTYATDPQYSVAFSDDKLWFAESVFSVNLSGSSTGAPVQVNQKQFKLHNKLLFTMLTNFKPWEDDVQSNTVLKVLEHVPELIPPYCNFLASHGTHDPKMTSYWFGSTLLLGRIMKLPIPDGMFSVQTDLLPSITLVMDNILPSPITKNALTKSLQHEVPLIKQLGCQMLVFSFQKLETVLEMYSQKGWDSEKATLTNNFHALIPDLAIVTSILNEVYSKQRDNKLLSLSLTIILRYYSKFFPNFFNVALPSPNIYVDIMNQDTFQGVDLVILDNFLQYQELNNSQTKWWNAAKNENSLFTSLLKLSSSKNATNAITSKITALLDNLLHYTIIFNSDRLLASPISALINSLQVTTQAEDEPDTAQLKKIWKLLDETVSRCVKTPYKYVDISKEYGYISPFVIALSEQWKFVDKSSSYDLVSKWILIFLRNLVFVGESSGSMKDMIGTMEKIPRDAVAIYFEFEKYEENISNLQKSDYLLCNNVDFSFFQYITLLPLSKLTSISRYPVNDLDVVGLLFRVRTLLNHDEIPLNKYNLSSIFDDLLSRVGNYASTTNSFKFEFPKPKYFKDIILNPSTDLSNTVKCKKLAHVTADMIQIYDQLGVELPEFQEHMFSLFSGCYELWNADENLLNILNVAAQMLSNDQMLTVLKSSSSINQDIVFSMLLKLYEKKETMSNELFMSLLKQSSQKVAVMLARFMEIQAIPQLDFEEVFQLALENISRLPVAQQCLKFEEAIPRLEPHLKNITGNDLIIAIGKLLKNQESEEIQTFLRRSVDVSLEFFETASARGFRDIMELFCNCYLLLTEEEKTRILSFATTQYKHKYITPIAKFVNLSNSFESEMIKTWLSKSILFITKWFSESQMLSENFVSFLLQFKEILLKTNIWKLANNSSLNSQLEAILGSKWISYEIVMEYTNVLILGGGRSSIESGRMLQILIHNNHNSLTMDNVEPHIRFLTGSMIYNLYCVDVSKNSNAVVQEKLLTFYNGSVQPEDRFILKILEHIETKTSIPWTNYIYSWDFLDNLSADEMQLIGSTKLIIKEKEGFVVTLSKNTVNNSITNYIPDRPDVPRFTNETVQERWKQLQNFEQQSELNTRKVKDTIYDPLFILLTIINNDELVRQKVLEDGSLTYKFEVKKLLESRLLQFIISSLSDSSEVSRIALSIIYEIIKSLEENSQFKEGHILKVLLTRIAYTFHKTDANGKKLAPQDISPLIWLTIARISTVLAQPASFMFEKAFRWVLSCPSIRENEVPLLQQAMSLKNLSDGNEDYYKYLQWILDSVHQGLKTESDVNLLKARNVLEWLMNLLNSPYLSFKLRTTIKGIIYKLQRIGSAGSTLITRYAAISQIESEQQSVFRELKVADSVLKKNKMNKKHLKDSLVLQQEELNNQELGLGYSIILRSQKRLRDWVNEDIENITKRICP